MSSKNKPKPQADIFAAIASGRADEAKRGLIQPKPAAGPNKTLPLSSKPGPSADFRPRRAMSTAAELARELARERKRFAPFLRELAPKPATCRDKTPLKTFMWRVETESDCQQFSGVLAGKGKWACIQIPHYGGPLGRAAAYYRTTFKVTRKMMQRGALFACFRGVDYKAHVFMNGSFLGSHEGFFAPFEFDFTAQARPGANVLVVKVENDAICMGNDSWGENGKLSEGDKIYAATGPGYNEPEVGWHHCPPGMGIYQEVSIEARSRQHVSDIFVRPLPDQQQAEVWLELWNCDILRRDIKLRISVFGRNFEATAIRNREIPMPGSLGPGHNQFRILLDLPKARIWEPEAPWLHQIQATLIDPHGRRLDTAIRSFGMRSFRMDMDHAPKGRMYLNGREIRLRGANTMGFEQQDVMKQDWRQLIDDILLAKICHMNYWRLTQRPVHAEVYDYCSRLGLMTQTDLPLFGVMRRNQFCEGVRQAGEMERLVRPHPCNIMASYINEPFPAAWGKPWRHLTRPELEQFFRACDEAIRLENPDRVIKAVDGDYDPPGPGLPDNHCYCGWYNGHGISLGLLNHGYWQNVKPGWMHGCGEFGSEGLDPVNVMRKHYPKSWLPQSKAAEKNWTPSRIPQAQTGRFHYMWFDTPHTLDDWARASQQHQAWITRLMTEAFRRDARMNSFAIHLFIDAFPSGWMKAIMDVDRQPKPAYFAYREALTPLKVSLKADRLAFFSGETMDFEAWVCNDLNTCPRNARLAYRLETGARTVKSGKSTAMAPCCSAKSQGRLEFKAPAVSRRTHAKVRLALLDGHRLLHDTALEIEIFPKQPPVRKPVTVIGNRNGKAARLAKELGLPVSFTHLSGIILIDDPSLLAKREEKVRRAVQAGATAVLLEWPEGKHTLAGSAIDVKRCGMDPVQFASRATGHPLAHDFAAADFRFWHDPDRGHAMPLLERTFTAEGWTPILTSGNLDRTGNWSKALAAAEKCDGAGAWRLCNVKLSGRTTTNPAAAIFAQRLITTPPRPHILLDGADASG